MLHEVYELAEIVGRGIAKAAGFRRHEKPEGFEAGQSIVAVVIAVAVLGAVLALLAGWLFSR
jgi:hypothetical protein